ncbi:MAG: permease [Spirochaetaceae bacterium]|jgi:putative hydroxymethylpyrimidine transporter CytX|nr:permease [Spirochaetaceae bacterium]
MKKSAMFLLWVGAAISVSEIFTGGLLAPLGLIRGIAVILGGHLIGTLFLAGGAYISYRRKCSAMDAVGFSFGKTGGKLVALCNLIQLTGWIIILVVQAGSAIISVFPNLPFRGAALTLSILQIVWALIFGSPASRINNTAVVLLTGLCVLFFIESSGYSAPPVTTSMSLMLGIELSIAMPVSWLPVVGDYSCKAGTKGCAVLAPFLGYFLGSCFMYIIGLYIAVSSGKDIFSFIASGKFKYAACAIVLLSTMTTNFVALYSAAVSSRQWINSKHIQTPVLIIGTITLFISVFFPINRFALILEKFLSAITMVFVPVFMLVFLEYFTKKSRCVKQINIKLLIIVIICMSANWIFNKYSVFIPTIITIVLAALLFVIQNIFFKKNRAAAGGASV